MINNKTKLFIFGGALLLSFFYGVGVGHFEWQPYSILKLVKSQLVKLLPENEVVYSGEKELLKYAFTEPIINGDKIFLPITTLNAIHAANNSIFMPVAGFDTAYKTIDINRAEQLSLNNGATSVVRISFVYQGRNHEAYAYGQIPKLCSIETTAALVIPGTGQNQSSEIVDHDLTNYHYGIMDALGSIDDVFIFIKPNQDILAWHDGEKKLNNNFIVNYHLNHKGTYSLSYVVQSLAIAKYISECYGKTVIAGLSQGGAAALLNAVQSKPDIAIIASGYSAIHSKVEWSGFNQLIAPGVGGDLNDSNRLVNLLNESQTHYLFTWGLKENGAYRIDAYEGVTCNLLAAAENVDCAIHDGGHIFPVSEIKQYLETHLVHK